MRDREAWWIVGLGAVALAALGIRLAYLGAEPFWLDEAYTHEFNTGALHGVLTAYAQDIHPPLYGVLTYCWQSVAGNSEEALRVYSCLWSVVGLLIAAFLTRDVTGSRVAGLMSGLLLAVNPLDIWYAREARMYAQGAALMTMAIWVLWRWLRGAASTSGRWRLATTYGFLATSLLYTHYVAAVVVASQVVVVLGLFSLRRRWRDATALLGAGAAAGTLFVPWALFVHRFRGGLYSSLHLGWIPAPHIVDVFGYLNHEFFLGIARAPGAAAGWFSVAVAGLLGVVVTAAASANPAPQGTSSRNRREALVFLLWLAVGPALLAATISALWHPVYFRLRFSLFCLAPTLVAVVVLLTRVRPPLRTALVAAVAALMAAGAGWQAGSSTKWGMRELRRLAEARGEPEFVIVLPALPDALTRYYLPHAALQPSAETLQARLRSGGPATVWVCLRDGKIPPRGTPDGDFVSWLATTGPYRLLGHPDGLAVYELQAGGFQPTTLGATPAPE